MRKLKKSTTGGGYFFDNIHNLANVTWAIINL